MPGLDRGRHQPVAGVGDRRHAGVGHHQDVLAVAQRLSSAGTRAASLPSKKETTRPAGLTSRSGHSRRSRRVSSAAITGTVGERGAQPERGVAGLARAASPPAPPARVASTGATVSRSGTHSLGSRGVTATLEAPPPSTDPRTTRRRTTPTRRRARPTGPGRPAAVARPAPRAGLAAHRRHHPGRRRSPGSGPWASRGHRSSTRSTTRTEAQEILRYGYEDNRGYMFIVHPPLGNG